MDYNYYEDWNNESKIDTIENPLDQGRVAELFAEHEDELPGLVDENQTMSSCPFVVEANMHSEWAYKAPVLLILACNMVFLIYIMTVSIFNHIL